jgi:hypothetical protein
MPAPSRKPWPMRWIVVAIVVFVAGYTYVSLHYRKAAPPYLPYEDTRARARAARAGYERYVGTLERPADPVEVAPRAGEGAAGGLPAPLQAALVERLLLPSSIGSAYASGSADHARPYQLAFTCFLSDLRQQPGEAQIYVKEDSVLVVPVCERLAGGLSARSRENPVIVTIPAGSLPPGRVRLTVVGERDSRTWTVVVH